MRAEFDPARGPVPGMRAAFRDAWARRPSAARRLSPCFAGRRVRMDIAGAELAERVSPALAHLESAIEPAAPAALRVEMWDAAASGVPAPLWFEGRRAWESGRVVGHGSESSVAVYDRAARRLVACARDAARLSFLERARPLEPLLLVWCADQNCRVVHAGMVVGEGGDGILIAGAGRSGKSTTVFACVRAGFDFVADDCVAIEQRPDGSFAGASLSGSCLVSPAHVQALGGAGAADASDARGRQLVYMATAAPGHARAAAPLQAIVIPQIVGGAQAALQPLSRAEALRTLLQSALTMDPLSAPSRRGFHLLATLVERLPGYRLQAGVDLARIPVAMAGALRQRAERCGS